MPECRICLSAGSTEPLVQPCACAGSMGSVHPACLAAWVAEKGSLTCELCGQPYRQPHAVVLEPLAKAAAERQQQTHTSALAQQESTGSAAADTSAGQLQRCRFLIL